MSNISLRLPNSLHEFVRRLAEKDGVSINQFISIAVAEKVSALSTEDYLEKRAEKGNRQDFLKIMKKVPIKKPEPEDEIF
ncbi:MAG TPA: toxin-antitoxin system HicB family antitoxin [Candidatus Ozemobacteraceae bacterium]|nr:toxin-antitoxin system HicB family antitoxin [Candidatus Ozemobacteraceae bacterium]